MHERIIYPCFDWHSKFKKETDFEYKYKTILLVVEFCWQFFFARPLSEGKVLKQKFDDIFAATR